MKKIGLLFDERLSHDRKKIFSRNMTIFKQKYEIDIIPPGLDEDAFLEYVDREGFIAVLIPWHYYFAWKKAGNFHKPKIAGYFADTLLPFEFQAVPNYQNFILLDFYRFDLFEIELMLKLFLTTNDDTELHELLGKNAHQFASVWTESDQLSTRCIDTALQDTLFVSSYLQPRIASIRLFITSLWLAGFYEKNAHAASDTPFATFEIVEAHKRVAIRLIFQHPTLTSKDSLKFLWPTSGHPNLLFREMSRHCDFIKVYHYPETRRVSITAFFIPTQPCIEHFGEVRGFWIENRI